MKKNLLIILLVVIAYDNCFGQFKPEKVKIIDCYTEGVDGWETPVDSLTMNFDTIAIAAAFYKDAIKTVCRFGNSGSRLGLDYYFRFGKLVKIFAKEPSLFLKDLSRFSVFYYASDTIFYCDYYRNVRGCLAEPLYVDENKFYGYNSLLEADLLKIYSYQMLVEISKHRNAKTPK